jgi:hypothetical protein
MIVSPFLSPVDGVAFDFDDRRKLKSVPLRDNHSIVGDSDIEIT